MIEDNVDLYSPSNDPDLYDVAKDNKIQAALLNISGENVDNTTAPPSESIPLKNDDVNFDSVLFKNDKDNLSFTKSLIDHGNLQTHDHDYLGETKSTSTNGENLDSMQSDDQDYLTLTNTPNENDPENERASQSDNGNTCSYLYPIKSPIAKDEENSGYINADYHNYQSPTKSPTDLHLNSNSDVNVTWILQLTVYIALKTDSR